MSDFLWEMLQWSRVNRAQDDASAAARMATSAGARQDVAAKRIGDMARQIDTLSLACIAMWDLLKEKHGLAEGDLARRMEEIDLSDGNRDGKVRGQALACADCKRTMAGRHTRCIYCGSTELETSALEGVERGELPPAHRKPPR